MYVLFTATMLADVSSAPLFVEDLSLWDREWTCPTCRRRRLRDWNAVRKRVRAESLRVVAEGSPEMENASGLRVSLASASIAGLNQE